MYSMKKGGPMGSKKKMQSGGMHMMPDGSMMKNSMMENSMMKKGGSVKPKMQKGGSTPFGMLSVKKGIDKNPKPTQADRIAGATMKKGGSVGKSKMACGGMMKKGGTVKSKK
jgi:hypothetical protein